MELMVLFGGVLLGVYMLPTLVAFGRGHRHRVLIGLVNILVGWTFVGWFAVVFWAATDPDSVDRGKVS